MRKDIRVYEAVLREHRQVVDWLFKRVIVFLALGDFPVRFRDFRKSEDPEDRGMVGEIDPRTRVIEIDIREKRPSKILLHEVLHALFSFSKLYASEEVSSEGRIEELEDIFLRVLTPHQKRILRSFLPARPARRKKKNVRRRRRPRGRR